MTNVLLTISQCNPRPLSAITEAPGSIQSNLSMQVSASVVIFFSSFPLSRSASCLRVPIQSIRYKCTVGCHTLVCGAERPLWMISPCDVSVYQQLILDRMKSANVIPRISVM